MRHFHTAVLHCAAVPTGWSDGKSAKDAVKIIDGWHRERGFAEIGYHFVVDLEGNVATGRSLQKNGAHVLSFNAGTVGVLMLEHTKIEKVGSFSDYFNKPQAIAVRGLLSALKACGLTQVKGHNQFTNHSTRLCPGFVVNPADWL